MDICVRTNVCMYVCMYVCMCASVCMCESVCMCASVCMYMGVYVYVCVCMCVLRVLAIGREGDAANASRVILNANQFLHGRAVPNEDPGLGTCVRVCACVSRRPRRSQEQLRSVNM